VSGVVPGVERQPLKKLEPDATALSRLIESGLAAALPPDILFDCHTP
jgi:hypothetical protein